MTDHQTMNTIIHAAFRRDLSRFDDALATFPSGSQARADELKRAWDWFESEVRHHHKYEEEVFWPALRRTDADLSSVAELDEEHHQMRGALDKATSTMEALHAHPTTVSADAARKALASFSDVLLGHLEHEERDLEPINAAYQDAPPMKTAAKKVIRAQRGRLGNILAWLQDGADADARRALRRQIPAPVVVVVTALAGRRYRRDVASVWA